ncbi:MAG: hypothetical protein SP4CHLAM5_08300 [Chlamydiia bacterium]|nr:hypothetical protein [Chlamydiia bacterium]MCH9618693.1 hypothetical protein [Chlamydiia bacterium]MCH9624404.1 hypothetical protein [Chlamydiia bacterium]
MKATSTYPNPAATSPAERTTSSVFLETENNFTATKAIELAIVSIGLIGLATCLLKSNKTETAALTAKVFNGKRSNIEKKLKSWSDTALKKYNAVHKAFYLSNNYPSNYKGHPPYTQFTSKDPGKPAYLYDDQRDQFTQVYNFVHTLESSIAIEFLNAEHIYVSMLKDLTKYKIAVCVFQKKLQAIAFYTEGDLVPKHIVTNPKNIDHKINSKVRLAGSALALQVFIAKQSGRL